MQRLFGAVDIGASSGRVIAGIFRDGKLSISEVHRFPNRATEANRRLVWNFDSLLAEVKRGLRELGARAERLGLDVTSIGIDTWAVDYGLLDETGSLIAQPNCYRDLQNELGVREVHNRISFEELYSINGLQFLPFNTLYQLSKHRNLFPQEFEKAKYVVLLPDLIGYFLTGKLATERTNASSTGLLNATTKEWSTLIASKLDLDLNLFPPLAAAGSELGVLKKEFGPRLGGTKVVLVGSHDTASAVVGVPSETKNFAFLSSGTWSLLGAELQDPILTNESRNANFTNELGVDDRNRYLKNLSGLWLLSESIRYWEERGETVNLQELLEKARSITPEHLLDVNDQDFITPGEMPLKLARQLERAGFGVPNSKAEFTALILHSLASSYGEAMESLESLSGLVFDQIHVIGGGSQNQLLSDLTAKYCNKRVVSGPVEATAIGNLLVQARVAGLTGGELEQMREVILHSDFLIN